MARTVLITGANRGLGLALTHACLRRDDKVIACCRDPDRARALHQFAEVYPTLSLHRLDVMLAEDYLTLKAAIGATPIDLMVANAGVLGPKLQRFGRTDYHAWGEAFSVNAMAPLRLAEQFMDNLRQGESPLLIAISSVMASITNNQEGEYYLYRSSKAALNAVVKSLAIDLADEGIRALAIHPGWMKTEMGGEEAPLTPEDAAVTLLETLDRLGKERTGEFLSYCGEPLPW